MMVEISDLCETLHCLPSDLFAQDPQWVERMKAVLSIRAEWQREKEARQNRGSRS